MSTSVSPASCSPRDAPWPTRRKLSGALADRAASDDSRAHLVGTVFASLGETTRSLLQTVARQRWSSPDDLVDAVEELGIRVAAAVDAGADVEGELFDFARVVARTPSSSSPWAAGWGTPPRRGAWSRRC
ncbi:hypothetical protein [Microbacterium elymi]|uniref:Uncharacterized protein n=1 Tax=Microbacterium elymi TaxID=2909587 RepID=A0ABY5NIQ4_9MICO|nr:hypothetical protein [Microbacterium elymi]UUT35028.1 hypothetical protein L2X98_32445 [Microbacterium elymi]